MSSSKYIFAFPPPGIEGWTAGTRRRALIVSDTLIKSGKNVKKEIWEECPNELDLGAIYIFQMHHIRSIWKTLKNHQGVKFVVDIPESILTSQDEFARYAPWPLKFRHYIARCYYKLYPPDPLKVTVDILKRASAIICASELQVKEFNEVNSKVFFTWDVILVEEYNVCKLHSERSILSLVWEGGGSTVFQIEEVAEAIRQVQLERNVKLIVIADVEMAPVRGISNTEEFLKSLKIDARFVKWDRNSFTNFLLEGDIGIAPLNWRRRFYWQKGANKAQVLHAIGLPVIASDIPAYRDWIELDIDGFVASTVEQWKQAILTLCDDWELRASMGQRGAERSRRQCSPESIANQWLEILESV